MINFQQIQSKLVKASTVLPSQNPQDEFKKISEGIKYNFLFESKDISPVYGRMSLLGSDPVIKISGKENSFEIEVINARGLSFLKQISSPISRLCDKVNITEEKITGTITTKNTSFEESERSKQQNIGQIIRVILQTLHVPEKVFLGLYGAFSYDFIRLFEDIGNLKDQNEINDFTLFLFDTFILFDHLKHTNEIIIYRENENQAMKDLKKILSLLDQKVPIEKTFQIKNAAFDLSQTEYEKLVKTAQKYASEGELFEVVFSNTLRADFSGDAFALYQKYSRQNPSPYLFYFDFNNEQLVGASPEMMVRCENNIVSLRPISGTAKRGKDPIEDHENMLKLLTDPKERAELDMLIDLGRNDISRVCEPGVEISDYRFVEKYSRVMHTVAHLSGKLRKDCIAYDALIVSLNAGTLTGAPKVAAMKAIEKHESQRRGYYGGTIGYLTLSGDMDTAIIIRTAHIKDQKLSFQVGATLLHYSKPENEYKETLNKASAFLHTVSLQQSL